MKKLLCIVNAVLLSICLSACSSNDKTDEQQSSDETSQSVDDSSLIDSTYEEYESELGETVDETDRIEITDTIFSDTTDKTINQDTIVYETLSQIIRESASASVTKSPETKREDKQTSKTDRIENSACAHKYKLTSAVDSTCATAGSKTYTCSKCNFSYKDPIAMKKHNYNDAACMIPKTCKNCFQESGSALGHSYGSDKKCTRCGLVSNEVNNQAFTVSVRNDKSLPVANVTVTIYNDAYSTDPIAVGNTNKSGIFTVDLEKVSCYRIVLSNLPDGYTANESYTASNTSRINISLKYNVVENTKDHSYADYKVGSTMWDFTVTDTDGNLYTLSKLLDDKKLVILDFWYVACSPCKAEFPYFEAVHQKYDDDITILAMNHFDSEESIKALREELEVTFPMVKEELGLRDAFDITNYPTTVMVNDSGKIVSIHRDAYASEEEFLKIIESLIK